MLEWISVEDCAPPREPILTTDGKEQHVAYPNFDTDHWYTGSGINCHYCGGQPDCDYVKNSYYRYTFTHWMPLPQLPQEKNLEMEKIRYVMMRIKRLAMGKG